MWVPITSYDKKDCSYVDLIYYDYCEFMANCYQNVQQLSVMISRDFMKNSGIKRVDKTIQYHIMVKKIKKIDRSKL